MDQSGEDCRIIRGEVEGGRVCFLQQPDALGVALLESMLSLREKDTYLELPTEEFAKVLGLDP